ncbi:hypothetical protein Ahy_B04g068920 isoform L [Arachis hypogaea]|uniref:Protein LAZ1 n=1 Tax=Arachis hypogaea TaxID=3818 RepID=A0A444ZB16_ARAHY|nr:hypothetical protein Ahy_B04g068920 isoform L [Arachis hypogaea]
MKFNFKFSRIYLEGTSLSPARAVPRLSLSTFGLLGSNCGPFLSSILFLFGPLSVSERCRDQRIYFASPVGGNSFGRYEVAFQSYISSPHSLTSMNNIIILLSYSPPAWATIIAAAFLLLTLTLSMYLLFEHLSAYKNPEEQKFLIGVILMVPCYSIESFVSLVNPSISVDCEILRDCYESFAMYCFGRYLVACLGGEERTIEFMEREGRATFKTPLLHTSDKGTVKHPFPMNYFFKPWILGRKFYQIVKFGIVQYVCLFITPSHFNYQMYPYMAIVLNFSQSWALYCLVQFYTVTKEELAHIQPLAKFLTFKSIVFLTWWQGVAIALLYTFGLFKSPIAQGLQFKSSVQDFIICIEVDALHWS